MFVSTIGISVTSLTMFALIIGISVTGLTMFVSTIGMFVLIIGIPETRIPIREREM